MRRLVCIMTVMAVAATALAQSAQDFASRFMQMCDEDTAVVCVTVSPKMMEQLGRQNDAEISEDMAQAIHKLKSARIVTATSNSDVYYDRAEKLLVKNNRRFRRSKSYNTQSAHGTFYTRQTKNGNTVELILLHNDTRKGTMVIVNLTGDIDKEFIDSLAKHFGVKTACA
ncbi:DUF4252 domain-containing protein [Prevotella sp. MGM1]|uniref:DUF4252 domain-containing protein n=1 Tax=Prevotella sp. MGM1 TaxID=2033405 RepID=UPI000CEA421F|nr:DUF4252 domain-containing protein [Prevotella sp. MGM1]